MFTIYDMKIMRLFWLFLTMAVILLPLAAQAVLVTPLRDALSVIEEKEVPSKTEIFAPFVSRLQGELKNNLIRLSWVDSPDVRGPVYVYRSSIPFETTGLQPEIRPVEVPYGIGSFVDEIETGGTAAALYYFAVASDQEGRSYDIPIAYTNTISIQLPAENSASFVPAAVPRQEPGIPPDKPFGISSLQAVARDNGVLITFSEKQAPSGTSGAVLYRSFQPLRQTPDLLGAVIVQTKISSPFTDYPVPDIPYYYAVITEEDLIRGTVEIVPGHNATLAPVKVSTGRTGPGQDIRAMPLPQISVQGAIPALGDYADIPPPKELSPEAAKALGDLPARSADAGLKTPRVFARDIAVPQAGGEEYALSLIVKGSFAVRNWEAARDELIRFLALPRSPETKARARFYLGQCSYFLRQPREGLFEFLSIQDRYPIETREWIQASLDMLKDTQ